MYARPIARAATVVLLGACARDSTGPRTPTPVIDAATITANEHNVLSAIVTVVARDADSVVVRYRQHDASLADEGKTPAIVLAGGAASVPVLGLRAATMHDLTVVAFGARGRTATAPLTFETGPLPVDLPHYFGSGIAPSPGYVVFAAVAYAVAIDNAGRVVWYRRFPNGPGLNFMAQPTGNYVLRPATPAIGDIEPWLVLDPLGNIVRQLTCANGLPSRLHDLILEADGSYRILCDEVRTMDLSTVGGVAGAQVTGTVLQHVEPGGALRRQWSSFDYFEITDVDLAERRGLNVNWTHGNALDLDSDGNILLSFRNLGEITKVHATTGETLWRLGGRRNEFTFIGTTTPAFLRQHGVRWAGQGTIVLLDNLGDPTASRAERYVIDEGAHTARLAVSYGSAPGVVTEIGGSVQLIAGGRTLVSFGTAGRVEEYDAEGRVMWRIEGNAGYVFRAQRILSLYAPGVGTAR